MSVPALSEGAGVYRLDWRDEAISMRFDRLSEDSKYNVTAELLITTSQPGVYPHIHQARLNLTSTAARRTLAGHLAERVNSLDWHGLMEQGCVKVLQRYREGEPFLQLSELPVPEKQKYLLWPLLQDSQSTVFYGQGESGKSFLALYLAVLVTLGLPGPHVNASPGNVVYLDYETDQDTMWERVNMITSGLNHPIPDNIYYRYMTQQLSQDIEQVQRFVLDKSIDLVIIDSAAPAVGEPESSQPVSEYFRALRTLRCTTLTIAHVTKGGKEDQPFGSVFWRNLPRANFKISASHEPGEPQFTIGLKHTKSNNDVRLQGLGFSIAFDSDAVQFSKAQPRDLAELESTLTLKERLEVALSSGKMSVQQLAEELDANPGSVKTTLNRYRGRSFVDLGKEWALLVNE